jgi:rhamnulokinase
LSNYLAFDLGAESGRAMLGRIDGGRLSIEEIHRFPNDPVWLPTGLYWDTLRLYHEVEAGLRAVARLDIGLDGIGIDTWGVDFGFLAEDGALADNPRHYRDPRNNGMLDRTFATLPRERIFASTGLQFMQLNSLYQWYAMKLAGSPALRGARTLLFMPDLFHYFLTGVKRCERTIASTSQFYNPVARTWAVDVLDALGLDASLLPEIVDPGAQLGPLLEGVADRTGLPDSTMVYATASHDTASAVAAVPASEGHWCYISSGTWSLMGVELDSPLVNGDVLAANFTNETGAAGRVRLLKNIAGLWLIQECRRAWALAGEDHTYAELTEMAAGAPPLAAVVDPDAFLEPGHMPERIAAYCEETGQPAPSGKATLCRVIFESLALRYRQVVENLDALTGRPIGVIHIVGGGSRNGFLNQMVANCTGRTVIAGPAEATAVGNVLVQAIGAGQLKDLAEARDLVRQSFSVTRHEPRATGGWEEAYRRFAGLREAG